MIWKFKNGNNVNIQQWKVKVLVAQSCPTLLPTDSTGSSVREILQARILDWVAMPFSRVSSLLRDQTQVTYIADRFFIVWATREVHSTMDYW